MTKQQEVAKLDAMIKQFGDQSYLGPWLKEHRDAIVSDITSDLPLTRVQMPSEAVRDAAQIRASAVAEAAEIVARAKREGDALIAAARAHADSTRAGAKRALEAALRGL